MVWGNRAANSGISRRRPVAVSTNPSWWSRRATIARLAAFAGTKSPGTLQAAHGLIARYQALLLTLIP